MCNLEIHMGMENHVLLGQQNQDVIIVSIWQGMSCRHCCTKLGFVIRRHYFYPFLFGYNAFKVERCFSNTKKIL